MAECLDAGFCSLVIITPGCLPKGGEGPAYSPASKNSGEGGRRTVKAHDEETLEKKLLLKITQHSGIHTYTGESERHSTHEQKQTKTVYKCSLLYSSRRPKRGFPQAREPVKP